jgi:hypothetical protein
MAVYVDYNFYVSNEYLGKAIAQADFPFLALRASAVIDQITFGRAAVVMAEAADNETITAIRRATCAVADEYQALDKTSEKGGEIASERVGNYAVTYVQDATSQLSVDAKLARAARLYLLPTGLLYAGFDENER